MLSAENRSKWNHIESSYHDKLINILHLLWTKYALINYSLKSPKVLLLSYIILFFYVSMKIKWCAKIKDEVEKLV